MKAQIAETWCRIEIYNEYLKKIAALLTQINTVEKMQCKAEQELAMLQTKNEDSSKEKYQQRLLSTQTQCEQRLKEMLEELSLIQAMKEELENTLPILKSKQ